MNYRNMPVNIGLKKTNYDIIVNAIDYFLFLGV